MINKSIIALVLLNFPHSERRLKGQLSGINLVRRTKGILILFCFLTITLPIRAQIDTLTSIKKYPKYFHFSPSEMKNNFVYIMPTSIGGDLFFDLQNFWLETGYCRKIAAKRIQYVDIKLGVIALSQSSRRAFPYGLNAKKSNGFNLNLEHKIILIKKFYYSSNLFYQRTITIRDGEYDESIHKNVSENNYKVLRSVYCIQPKVGFMFVNKFRLYTDVGLAIGIRYVQSNTIDKINTNISSGRETFVNKEFDKGAAFAQKISLQIKIGYNF